MRRTLVSAVLALAVLAGQWLAAAHDGDHGLQAGAADACAVCVYAQGAGSGALPHVGAFVAVALAAEAPARAGCASLLAGVVRHHPIRGPPVLLA